MDSRIFSLTGNLGHDGVSTQILEGGQRLVHLQGVDVWATAQYHTGILEPPQNIQFFSFETVKW